MFCSKCGKSLLDGDRFCSFCGAQVIDRSEKRENDSRHEEVVFNRIESDVPSDIGAPDRSIVSSWKDLNGEKVGRNSGILVDWNQHKFLTFDLEEEKQEKTAMQEESCEVSNSDNTKETADEEIAEKKPSYDIFEEFEKQLKEETEEKIEENPVSKGDTRIFSKWEREELLTGGPVEPEKRISAVFENKDNVLPSEEEAVPEIEKEIFAEINERSKALMANSPEEQINKFYTFSKKNEEFQKLLDREYEKIKGCTSPVEDIFAQISNVEKLQIDEAETMPGAAAALLEALDDRHNEAEKEEEGKKPAEEKDAPAEPSEETEADSGEATAETVPEPVEKEEQDKVTAEEEGTVDATEPEEEKRTEAVQQEPEPVEESTEPSEIENPAEKSADEPADEKPLPWEKMEAFQDESKPTSTVGKVIGTILVVAILTELVMVGTTLFFPQSKPAEKIKEHAGILVNWTDKFTEKENTDEYTTAMLDTSPTETKEALIQNALALGLNVYIKEIKADDSLGYVKGYNYGDSLINKSKPITDNIWYTDDEGGGVAYDQEVINAVIGFDSAWIGYVNRKEPAVFDFLFTDSSAYESAKGYAKAGKDNESLDLLRIGEIRQAEGSFFVWTAEKYTMYTGDSPVEKEYYWIYIVQPEEKTMKVSKFIAYRPEGDKV